MEFVFEVIFEIFVEGIFAVIYYFFNKFFKHKISRKTAKIISGFLAAILIVGGLIIFILILNKIKS